MFFGLKIRLKKHMEGSFLDKNSSITFSISTLLTDDRGDPGPW